MSRKLTTIFMFSFFISLVEMSLFNTYIGLFLKNAKFLESFQIAQMMSINFLVSLVSGFLIGFIIDALTDYKPLLIGSLILLFIAIWIWIRFDSVNSVYAAFFLYNFSKGPILRLQDMLVSEAGHQKLIDIGKTRGFASVGYATAPLIFSSFFINGAINYDLLMITIVFLVTITSGLLIYSSKFVKFGNNSTLKKEFKWNRTLIINLAFIIVMSFVFNATNGLNVMYQSIYFEQIFGTVQLLGLLVLIGSVLEWPVMIRTSKLLQAYGYQRMFTFLALLVSCRWLIYYFASSLSNMPLFFIAASLNGVAQAIFVPVSMTYLRGISTSQNYGVILSVYGTIGTILSWLFNQSIAIFQKSYGLQQVYLLMAALSFIWFGLLLLKKLKYQEYT